MKKIILTIALFLLGTAVADAYTVWRSSWTKTSDKNVFLTTTTAGGTVQRGIIHGVCIDDPPTSGTHRLGIYNSSVTVPFPTTGLMIDISASTATTQGCKYYDIAFPRGIMYTSTGTASINILYQTY